MGYYKNLRAWQDGIDLATEIYQLTNTEKFSHDFGLKDQIRGAAVSIPSNIAEGEERESVRENIRFLNIAKASGAEVVTQLHIAHRIGYIDQKTLNVLEDRSEKIIASIKNLIRFKIKKLQT